MSTVPKKHRGETPGATFRLPADIRADLAAWGQEERTSATAVIVRLVLAERIRRKRRVTQSAVPIYLDQRGV